MGKSKPEQPPNLVSLFLFGFWLKFIQSSDSCPIETRLYHVP